jgi:hypothetical protein
MRGRDQSVIATVCRGEKNNYYVLDVELLPAVDIKKGELFDKQCEKVLDHLKRNSSNGVVVEQNFALALANELKLRARERRARVGIKSEVRKTTQNKGEFIGGILEPLIKTGRFYCHVKPWKDTPFKTELGDFPHGRHDDCLDAVAGAIFALSPGSVRQEGELLHKATPRGEVTATQVNYR